MRIKQAIKELLVLDVSYFIIDGTLYLRVGSGKIERVGKVEV